MPTSELPSDLSLDYAQSSLDDYDPQHLTEWKQSSIDADIIMLNFVSVGQDSAFSFLVKNPDRRNAGRLTDQHLKTHRRLESGGWSCSGIDPSTMMPSEWGCLKPNQPRWDEIKKRHIKYEHPHGIPTELFCLRVTYRIGLEIARQQGSGAEAEYLDRMGDSDSSDEDRYFWRWVIDTPSLIITVTEGAKKAACLLSIGCLAVALPGIFSGYRSKIDGVDCIPHLIPQLELFTARDREIAFCFDRDTNPKTILNVNIAIDKTGKLLRNRGSKVSVIVWDDPHKGVDDLIYNLGGCAFHHLFSRRRALDGWSIDKLFSIDGLEQKKVDHRYIDLSDWYDDLPMTLNCIKSPKNSGKSTAIGKLLTNNRKSGGRILILTHRIQLGKVLAKQFGVEYIADITSGESYELGHALCVDSLHLNSRARFRADYWRGATLVIDEVEQVLWHMLNSETCRRKRSEILQNFESLLRVIAESDGTIILSDADLSKVSIEYIQHLTGSRMKTRILNNIHFHNSGNRKLFIHKTQSKLLASATNAIASGENIIIHCSAQQSHSKWSTQNIESYFIGEFPNIPILRVDSDTTKDPTHPAFGCADKINDVAKGYGILIPSPTLETGTSIDIDHFGSVWALANGVQPIDGFCQTIERVRSDVPRHICITTGAIETIGNGSTNPYSLTKSINKVASTNINLLSLAGFTEDSRHQHHLDVWAKYAAKINEGYHNYEQAILDKLESEGYEIIKIDDDESLTSASVKIKIETMMETNYEAERGEILSAPILDHIALKKLQKKTTKTKSERRIERKGLMVKMYATNDITDDLIIKDDNGWHPQLTLFYYLTIGRKHLKTRDTNTLNRITADASSPLPTDITVVARSAKIRALLAVNIEQFFGEDKTFTADSLGDWFEKLKGCRRDIRDYLGVGIGDKSTPITTAQRLLKVLGYNLTLLDQIKIEGKVTRRYGGVLVDFDDRSLVLARWLDRDDRVEIATREKQSRYMAEMLKNNTTFYRSDPENGVMVDLTPSVDTATIRANMERWERGRAHRDIDELAFLHGSIQHEG